MWLFGACADVNDNTSMAALQELNSLCRCTGRWCWLCCSRLQQLLLLESTTVTDADLATWMQPLLYLAADAAAAAAAAAGAAASSSAGATADGRGMLGSSAGAADLALADAAMTTLAAAVAAGGPLVKVGVKQCFILLRLDVHSERQRQLRLQHVVWYSCEQWHVLGPPR
jgi:hypothetical protein